VRSDLLTGLKRVYGKVDILLFNPPYVPTDEEEYVASSLLSVVLISQTGSDSGSQGNRRGMGRRR
jgi:release factor glutamine methyltransferase